MRLLTRLGTIERSTYPNVTGYDGHISEVQRSVDLVHDVEGAGAVVVKTEYECQRRQSLLT